MKAKNVFIYEKIVNGRTSVFFRFTNRRRMISCLAHEYFVTCKKVSQLYKEVYRKRIVCLFVACWDVGWAYKYLGIPLDDKPWFQMKIAKLHSLVQK